MDNRSNCCWKSLLVACRSFGIITSLVLWGVGVEYVYYGTVFGIYFIIIAVITSFLEVVFLVNHVVKVCVSRGLFMRIWGLILQFDDWKKGGVYFIFFAPPCFVKPAEVMLGVLAGCLLIGTGILYMLKTFKTRRDEENAGILKNTSYNRFNDTQDVVEEDIENVTDDPPNGMTSVADQTEILDL